MVDRTTQVATLTPLRHPVTRGVSEVTYRDEFYPTLRFAARGVAAAMRAMLSDEAAPERAATLRTVAWAYQRPGGGRAFGFTGTHFLTSLDQAPVRQLLLNAIGWTAGKKVPAKGIRP
jgi:type 1 glutamine amidotransferase